MTPNSISLIEKAFSHVKAAWEQEMMRLALEAYYRQGGLEFPDADLSRIKACRGSYYAYIANKKDVLAVYLVSDGTCFSEKATSWPKALNKISPKADNEIFTPDARDYEFLWSIL